jgi:hypothetical protein
MIIPVPVSGKKKSVDICKAFIAGAPKTANGFVFYGVNETNISQYRVAKRSGLPVWCCDNSAFDCVRGVQFRVTKDRYHHAGRGETDGCRFAALGLKVAEPRDPAGFILGVEQSPSYMKCVANDDYWLAKGLVAYSRHPWRIRNWNRDKRAAMSTLAADLALARLTVTHSSAAAVESLLAGVPVHVSPMSPCYGVAMEDRLRLFGVLADNQFDLTEIRNGTAWKALNE